MKREKLEMMAALIASGLVTVGNNASEPELTAKRSVLLARAILMEIDAQLGPEKSGEND